MKPTQFYFSFDEMVVFLEKRGYSVRREEVSLVAGRVGNSMAEEIYEVFRVYKDGVDVLEWAKDRTGSYCVEFVFERELKKALLLL